jgi:hypothetical protein
MRSLFKRWWFWLGMLALLGVVGAGHLLLPVEVPLISQATCDKIQLGWSREEVVGLLGGFTGDLGEDYSVYWQDGPGSDRNLIHVTFDKKGVTSKEFIGTDFPLLRLMRRIRAIWP